MRVGVVGGAAQPDDEPDPPPAWLLSVEKPAGGLSAALDGSCIMNVE